MHDKTFEIGICMAGAVSAGAYTAGVIDYLLEALEDWESRKGQGGVPKHKVVLKVIGGASAGGMTGVIAASALNNSITPVRRIAKDVLEEHKENKLYHSWVDCTREDMFPEMLKSDDIKNGKVYSLLNSSFIDEISKRALKVDKQNWIERPYVDNHLKFFTTFTNLEGLGYNTKFNTNQTFKDYLISRHNDYGTFQLNMSDNQYGKDGWIPVDFRNDVNVEIARNAAMATGAFPVGLKSRRVIRDKKYMNDLDWHKDITLTNPVGENPYKSLIIDGGTIDNEPFTRVKSLLRKPDASYDTFESTVLMIDPFPSEAEKFDVTNDGLLSVVAGTLSAMLGHLRTKPEVLEETLMDQDASQFLIAPRRKVGGVMTEGSKAIACGFLGGFGGFLHKEFRVHDYFLGRANAEMFLREHFTFPKTSNNDLLQKGYEGVEESDFLSSDKRGRQIIPVFSEKSHQMYMPTFESGGDWPKRTASDITRFRPMLKKRIGKVILNLGTYSWFQLILLRIGNGVFIKGKLADTALSAIKNSMREHKLL